MARVLSESRKRKILADGLPKRRDPYLHNPAATVRVFRATNFAPDRNRVYRDCGADITAALHRRSNVAVALWATQEAEVRPASHSEAATASPAEHIGRKADVLSL